MLLIGIEARVSVKTHKQLDLAKTCGDKGGSARKTQQFSIQILIRKYCALVHTAHTHVYTHSLLVYICDTDLIFHAHTAIYS